VWSGPGRRRRRAVHVLAAEKFNRQPVVHGLHGDRCLRADMVADVDAATRTEGRREKDGRVRVRRREVRDGCSR